MAFTAFATFATMALMSSLVCCVPFVTKRVSFHNPMKIDFSGWRPIGHNADLQAQESSEEPSLDKQFLEVPVAVETDEEHVLSESELNQIREHVIHNWRQKPTKTESFPQMRPLVTQLLPKPEVELKAEEDDPNSEYTFVKMDKNVGNETQENLFHAYFAPKDHIPPDGYIKLTKTEFKNVFKNADILFV